MQTVQVVLREDADIGAALSPLVALQPDLVFAFGRSGRLDGVAPALAKTLPAARRIGCSAAFSVSSSGVEADACVLTGVRFDHVRIVEASALLAGKDSSSATGQRLAESLPKEGLRAVLLLGQGVGIRGGAFLAGFNEALGDGVPVVGGLASRHEGYYTTLVLDDSGVGDGAVVALGLYGEQLRFGFGVQGGWTPFGAARKVTRCEGNILYELDGEPALDVYRRYLGDYAKDLPLVGQFFPFAMLDANHQEVGLIRSMLGIDVAAGALKFGDDIVPGSYLRMMHASTDRLVSGAESAAESAMRMLPGNGHGKGMVFMVSCVGRELVMGERVEEEVEGALDVFGKDVPLAGFYSFGEISPLSPGEISKLHNQTVMVAYLDEWTD